ncbi:DUF6055 domain-containing protein [Rhizosphaericola mali]|uniref:Avirulence protein n=1 Tax=Rhizosphaericola mali TaxID=2545455 RepID=A0A5P2FZZ9_9BACT|nr:DUF6055 domain-containing protein [Rhizosphaericola mali]QES89116.1 hypothetical protein E0W69_010745 [Rhizosphaericola mali]
MNRIYFYIIIFLLIGIRGLSQFSVKELFIPEKLWKVPEHNNFNDTASKYNRNYMRQSADVAIIWPKNFGLHPELLTDPTKRFNPDSILDASESFYKYYVDTLGFVEKGNSISDKYKILFVVCDDDDGTAYGGGSEENPKIGILWTPTSRISYAPYGAVAHELGHVFQTFVSTDGGVGFTSAGQSLYEMTSQYMLWQVYPTWMIFENYHVKAFEKQTYLAFLHPDNMYHSPFILEYWSEKYGKNIIGKLWKSAEKGEDVVVTYKRIQKVSQKTFNNEMFDADRHLITWDLKRIKDLARPYANQFSTKLDTLSTGWLKSDSINLPQNYGFNAIEIPKQYVVNGKVNIQFKGLSTDTNAGWRYGFVAVDQELHTTYGKTENHTKGKIKFQIPANTTHLWFVVMGAPQQHTIVNLDPPKGQKKQTFASYPYQFKLL